MVLGLCSPSTSLGDKIVGMVVIGGFMDTMNLLFSAGVFTFVKGVIQGVFEEFLLSRFFT